MKLLRLSFVGLVVMSLSLYVGRVYELPMREVVVNSLIGVEIFGWFIVGEIIGRKSLIGYKV